MAADMRLQLHAPPCQLIDPESARDVVIEALLTLLASTAGPSSGWHGARRMVGAR